MSGWAAAASAAGGLLSTASSVWAAREAWKHQKEAMQNAHQWEVADLRKAGLNPILSATGGSGASTGGLNTPMPDMSGISSGINSAIAALKTENELKQQEANIDLTEQQTKQAKATTDAQWSNARMLNEAAAEKQMMNTYFQDNPNTFDSYMRSKVTNSASGLLSLIENLPKDLYNRYGK
jgi:hypothetical protein